MQSFLGNKKGLIPGFDDETLRLLEMLILAIHAAKDKHFDQVTAVKIGATPVLENSASIVTRVLNNLDSEIIRILDLQKFGNDVDRVLRKIASVGSRAGFDAIIMFPWVGPSTIRTTIDMCRELGFDIIFGAEMTIPDFLLSQGGFIPDHVPPKMFRIAAEKGVDHFVVPGNKLEQMKLYRAIFDEVLGVDNSMLMSPGLIKQGGSVQKANEVAGPNWHAIVGDAIMSKNTVEEMALVIEDLARQAA